MKRSSLLALAAALPLLAPSAPAQSPPAEAPSADGVAAPETLPSDELVRRGRELLARGDAAGAQLLLETADARSGGSLATRVWLVRCWIARGHVNDALDATDELANRGGAGAPLDYLYGLALHARAKQYIAQKVGGGMIEMNFGDAVEFLASATEKDPEQYADAFLPLAEAAWMSQDLPAARAAAERAVARNPRGFEEQYMFGRVAFSQFVDASSDEARRDEAEADWQRASSAFELAVELAGEPEDPARRNLLAQDHVQAALALIWKQRKDEAAEHFSEAIAWDPMAVDYSALRGYLEPLPLLRCIERGEMRFRAIHGPDAKEDALALWWLGWTNLEQRFYEESEKSFARAVAKNPAYADSHFYIGLARYYRQDYDRAIEAIVDGMQSSKETVSAAATRAPDLYRPILAQLMDRCATAEPPKSLGAAMLADLQTALAPEDALLWSYVGLFYRDAGDALRDARNEEERARRQDLYERSLAGYEHALELSPEHPNYLNDTAVVLHYCLHRDLERARDLYQRAAARAEAELARTDLDPSLRDLYTTALRDSRENLAKLDRERAQAAASRPE